MDDQIQPVTHRLQLVDFFIHYDGDSHQTAAIQRLQESIMRADPSILESTAEWFHDWTWCVGGKRDSLTGLMERDGKFVQPDYGLRRDEDLIGLD
jgi:hypothetical protein